MATSAVSSLGVVVAGQNATVAGQGAAGGSGVLGAPGAVPATPLVPPVPSAGSDSLLSSLSFPSSMASWGGYFEALAWLCFALALLWFVLWFIKRRGGVHLPGTSPAMRIESRLALGPKKWIIVTRYLDRRLVLGVTEQSISLITEIPLDDEAEGEENAPREKNSFAAFLKDTKAPPAG